MQLATFFSEDLRPVANPSDDRMRNTPRETKVDSLVGLFHTKCRLVNYSGSFPS